MRKIIFFCLFFCIAYFLFPNNIVAADTQINLDKQVAKPGDIIKLTLTNIDIQNKASKGYNLFLYETAGTTGSQRLESSIEIVVKLDGSCQTKYSNGWSNVQCQNFTLTGNYQLTNQVDADKQYKITLQDMATNRIVATQSFTIKQDVQESTSDSSDNDSSTTIFSISSITPNPANPGDDININIANANGSYEAWIYGQVKQTQECTSDNCVIAYKIPNEVKNPSVTILVRDSNNNQKSYTLSLNLPTPTTTPQPTVVPELQARCNTSLNITTLAKCNPQTYKIIEKATRCGDNLKGFVCKDKKEALCINGYNAEDSVTCEKPRPIPPPCTQWVDLKDNKIDPPDPESKQQMENAKCGSVNTAIGPIDTDVGKAITKLFSIILGLSGGIALILIIYSGYQLMMSQGNQEKVQGAKETLTSAIVGLLFIIFSLAIIQVIGADILKIPGFD